MQDKYMAHEQGLSLSAASGRDSRRARLEFNKLRKRLRRQVGKAIADFNLIEQGDRVMVCISGGKDSHAMLELLMGLRDSAPIDFEIVAVTLDQKQPGYPEDILPEYLESLNIPFYILERDTYSVVRSVIPDLWVMLTLATRHAVWVRRADRRHQDGIGSPPRRYR
jgi:tRNA 2-thiocytidine biosynthesis protein TtcA